MSQDMRPKFGVKAIIWVVVIMAAILILCMVYLHIVKQFAGDPTARSLPLLETHVGRS